MIELERNLADKKRRDEESNRRTRAVAVRERREKEIAAHELEAQGRQHVEDELNLLDSIRQVPGETISSRDADQDFGLRLAFSDQLMGQFVSSMANGLHKSVVDGLSGGGPK